MGRYCCCRQHARAAAANAPRLFYQRAKRAGLSPAPARFHEWVYSRFLFGPNLPSSSTTKLCAKPSGPTANCSGAISGASPGFV